MKWSTILSQPFPEEESFKRHVVGAVVLSIFVTAFLYFLQPFNLNTAPQHLRAVYAMQFGLVSFVVIILFELVLWKVLRVSRDLPTWTMGRWLMATLIMILFIAIGNYFLILHITNSTLSVQPFFTMLGATLIVAIFPVVFIGGLKVQKLLLANTETAAHINSRLSEDNEDNNSVIASSSNFNISGINSKDIYFVEALQNYVVIHYHENEQFTTKTIRSTLKDIESRLEGSTLVRCHRSYIVNKNIVKKVSGNAQGLQLSLEGLPESMVPVSRKYIPVIKA